MQELYKEFAYLIYDYRGNERRSVTKSLIEARPGLDMIHLKFQPTDIFYDYKKLFNIFERYVELAVENH